MTGNQYDFTGKTILITEEDTLNYLVLSAFLEGTGATVLHAENSDEAIEFFELDTNIDLVFMDLNLPKFKNKYPTKYIKEIHPNTPVIAHTNMPKAEVIRLNGRVCCDGYMPKPVQKEEFLEITNSFMNNVA
jgi:CheY-like chemotaxis protein